MRKKKNYSLHTIPLVDNDSVIDGPAPWEWKISLLTIDFRRWLHFDGDYGNPFVERGIFLDQCREALWGYRHGVSDASIKALYESGLCELIRFIDRTGKIIYSISDLSEEFFIELVSYFKKAKIKRSNANVSYATARRRYSSIKTLLTFYIRRGMLEEGIFPVNPFPNVNRQGKGTQPYSKDEMTRIMRALYSDYRLIKSGRSELSPRIILAIYQLLIIAKTGINQKPLEEASRDCLQPHPLNPEKFMVLVTHKRRGMNTHATSLRRSDQIERIEGLPTSVAALVEEAIRMTEPLVSSADEKVRNRIWIYESGINNEVVFFKGTYFNGASRYISQRHQLIDDLGKPLVINSKRLRKTFSNRIWQITDGDIWKTSRIMGNTPSVTDRHYLDVSPEMERKHKFVGKAFEITIRGIENNRETIESFADEADMSIAEASAVLSGEYNTAVSRCSSPYLGKFAAGDGTPCTRILECFRCPNQIVLKTDLHRLFSFYWLILRERPVIGRRKWKKFYSWVIREIDNEISSRFDTKAVNEAKKLSLKYPHPLWRDRSALGVED